MTRWKNDKRAQESDESGRRPRVDPWAWTRHWNVPWVSRGRTSGGGLNEARKEHDRGESGDQVHDESATLLVLARSASQERGYLSS